MAKITWLGHAAFKVESDGLVALFDPWIEGNPASCLNSEKDIDHADIVLVSHDHRDHGSKDGALISKRTGAAYVGVFELVNAAKELGVENGVPGNIGGIVKVGNAEICLTRAYHSSGVGVPCGFVLKLPSITVYHAGDTAYFSDMEHIGTRYKLDAAILPIGSTYTMDPLDASEAVKKLKPGVVIPCHYNTFPAVEQDPETFKDYVAGASNVRILNVGQSTEV